MAEDGREYYAQNLDCDLTRANQWVRFNVIPHLTPFSTDDLDESRRVWRYSWQIAADIRAFVDPDTYGKPQFWGYFADYDWVVLCQLFGTMTDLPKGWPMYCRDIKQWCDELGNPKLPEQDKGKHHALADARWNRRAWEFLDHFICPRARL